MERKVLHDLHSSEYEHPFDRKALESLKATPGLPALRKAAGLTGRSSAHKALAEPRDIGYTIDN